MTLSALLPVLILATSLVPSVLMFLLPERAARARTVINVAGAAAKVVLVFLLLRGVAAGATYEARFALVPGLELLLRVDALSLLFLTLSAVLWLATTVYALSYLAGTPDQNRFFAFFSLCVVATTGIALAGTPITFFFFYELLTLATYPLVVHRGDPAALAGGRKYLAYTLAGSIVLLVGIVWLESMVGPIEFTRAGALEEMRRTTPDALRAAFVLLVGGLAVKAALVPLHSWLPSAMVAPAPVSALLHAVAVVKAGAFGIVRVIFDVYGIDAVEGLGLGVPLAAAASATILYGSVRALTQSDIKRRLAYSTVSQVSYIVLGVALGGPTAAIGGLVHLVHQGLMKVTLFFCAGAFAETVHVHRIDQMDGLGPRMPWTMLAFSIAAFGMIGVPPVAGFVSKWYLGIGSLEAGHAWVILVLAVSSLLNAAYFLPLVYRAWFLPPAGPWEEMRPGRRYETDAGMFLPPVATSLAALLVGLLAATELSPLSWTRLIVERGYAP
ncbi:complex I subunit 5 family protein [Arenibaculum sp.]|uniref:complex I subunit 5 family protein n=1 Tax=Arenibaculum sp. TaxID=2865862 RepID=UPI002E0FC421|nr:proton-conducting transporter membrane subunit [Arenibaculum sp.]